MSDFVHLHLHSQYSLLDGAIRIQDLVRSTAEMGMSSVAVTDHGNMYATIDFYTAAKKAGIKPIVGTEAYVTTKDHRDKDRESYHLVLLAKDLTGYQNLVYLTSMAHTQGFYYYPRMDHQLLRDHSEGLIAMSACLGGEVPSLLLDGNLDEARDRALMYQDMFGAGNYFLEVQSNGLADQEKANALLAQLSEDTGIPLVGTNDSHYLRAEDARAHEMLLCIQTGKTIHDADRMQYGTDQLYLKNPDEMIAGLSSFPGAIENTARVAELCDVEIELKNYKLPQFPIPAGYDLPTYFEKMAREGLDERFAEFRELGREVDEAVYRDRLEMEIEVIRRTGFTGYFLVVSDFIIYAKEQDIPVGPGRGSGAGSLVAYSLRITDIDPIRYDLLFERFLNAERISMPDFDVDFCQDRRDEVIRYVTEKYGKEKVSQIITFGTLKARAVIRDVGRVMGLPYGEVDKIAKLVPEQLGITLDKALSMEPKLPAMMQDSPAVKDLIEVALRLEGLNRHAGIHAAGVVISDKPLWEYVPLARGKDNVVVTQFAKDEVELAGMVKFDFLGLKTLTVIAHAVRWIRARPEAAAKAFEIDRIPLDDPKVYELISRADTLGVFQLESSGFRELLKRIRPDRFEDIIASVALYRPGPLEGGMVDDWIDRKHGQKKVVYPHPLVAEVLKETHGVIVYQEQVMRIAAVLAGYTLGEADELRKGMGKKIEALMQKHDAKFNEQAVARGIDAKVARGIFDTMAKFAKYGFNKSHSAAYAAITYQTAYLKAHYPTEFMCAMLTLDKDNTDKVIRYMGEARRMGIDVTPPDVNRSTEGFTIDGPRILFGLGAVKGVGSGAIESIVEARAKGPFADLLDFCDRVDLRRVNRKVVEALIRSGAFDSLGQHRSVLMNNLDRALARAQQMARDRESGQLSLLGGFGGGLDPSSDSFTYQGENTWSTRQALAEEREALGFYLSAHPLDRYVSQMANFGYPTIQELLEKEEGRDVELAVIITSLDEKMTKAKQKKFGALMLEDLTGRIEAVLFPDAYETHQALAESPEPLYISGKLQVDGDEPDQRNHKIIVREMRLFEAMGAGRTRRVRVRYGPERLPPAKLARLKRLLDDHPGQTPFSFVVPQNGSAVELVLGSAWFVKPTTELYEALEMLFGNRNVSFS
jgi:DNA polymerase III subunit alpha